MHSCIKFELSFEPGISGKDHISNSWDKSTVTLG